MTDAVLQPASVAQARTRHYIDRLVLVALCLVTCLVSLPRFHRLMLADDEADARLALTLIAEARAQLGLQGAPMDLPSVLSTPYLRHRLADARALDGRDTAAFHGYFLQSLGDPRAGPCALIAWPIETGRTGRFAYLRTAEGALLESGGRSPWSGLVDRPAANTVMSHAWRTTRLER